MHISCLILLEMKQFPKIENNFLMFYIFFIITLYTLEKIPDILIGILVKNGQIRIFSWIYYNCTLKKVEKTRILIDVIKIFWFVYFQQKFFSVCEMYNYL